MLIRTNTAFVLCILSELIGEEEEGQYGTTVNSKLKLTDDVNPAFAIEILTSVPRVKISGLLATRIIEFILMFNFADKVLIIFSIMNFSFEIDVK